MKNNDPDGIRLPIKLDTTTNGEFSPLPLEPTDLLANKLAQEQASINAKRSGMNRRQFMVSACGAASTLLAFNKANAAALRVGGSFDIPADAVVDPKLAATKLEGREFIFDVQGHFIGNHALPPGDRRGADNFVKDIFLDSDTDMMVLSFVPSTRATEPVTIQEADAVRKIVDKMEGTHRLLLHGRVSPNQAGDIDGMDELAERWGVSAWKCYTQWGPKGKGFFLSDEDTGIPFIEKARSLGVKVIAIHKGIPFGSISYQHSLCDDIGVVAKRYPDVNFLIYHSGWEPGKDERAYANKASGVDSLVNSLIVNNIAPNSNVYAELGSTWRGIMRNPDSAAHTLGKLFKYVGQDNVVWGTDSIWYGSPQDQIQAFRTFQISEQFQEQYDYPKMTPELRAKVFGLNAMKPYGISTKEVILRASSDEIAKQKIAYQENRNPHFLTFGPKTRREFLQLQRLHGNSVV